MASVGAKTVAVLKYLVTVLLQGPRGHWTALPVNNWESMRSVGLGPRCPKQRLWTGGPRPSGSLLAQPLQSCPSAGHQGTVAEASSRHIPLVVALCQEDGAWKSHKVMGLGGQQTWIPVLTWPLASLCGPTKSSYLSEPRFFSCVKGGQM